MQSSLSENAETAPLSLLYARLLDSQVERILAEQQPDGAFQAADSAYSIYDQNGMYPLALSYLRPGGPYEGDPRLLEAIRLSGDRHVREMDEEGRWEVVTPGGRWGYSFDEWRLHFWLETVLLLGERLGAERLAPWEEAILRGAGGIVALTRERLEQSLIDFVEGVCVTSPNHMAWYALVCRRAGSRYGRADWVELADDLFASMRAAQTPDGFWVEFAAPTVGYNYVTLLAVGVLWEHLGQGASPEWLACLARGMDAQLHWSYPDGGVVGEIEGRQRYHGPSGHALPAVCAQWPRGAAALRKTGLRLLSQQRSGALLSNVAAMFLCETARYLERHEQPDETSEPSASLWKAQGFEAGWRRVGPWQATLSGLVTPRYESRWRLDIANLVGLYHRETGLLAGGGHSKNDPQWATFTVQLAPDADPVWLPDRAELVQDPEGAGLRLDYGGVPVRVDIALSPEEATVRFGLEAPSADVTALGRLLRPLAPGTQVRGPDGEIYLLDADQPISWHVDAGGEIRIGSVRYLLPPDGAFLWPRLPFNPYNTADVSAAGDAFAAFETTLNVDHPEGTIRISVDPS